MTPFMAFPQTELTIGQPAAVYIPPGPARIVNGLEGFRVNLPSGAARLLVRFDESNFNVFGGITLAVRPGSDVISLTPTPGAPTVINAAPDHRRVAIYPAGAVPGVNRYFIALVVPQRTVPIVGTITAIAESLPPGPVIDVPPTAQVMLAGKTLAGYANYGTPTHSPPMVPVTAGRALSILSGGGSTYSALAAAPLTSAYVHTSGTTVNITLAPSDHLPGIAGPRGSLIGVFLGPTTGTRAAHALSFEMGPPDFFGIRAEITPTASDERNVKADLNQPFYIGTGLTSDRREKTFFVPNGATRLFLGVLENNSTLNTRGQVQVRVLDRAAPAATPPGNPVWVHGNAQALLALKPDGSEYNGLLAPWESPIEVGIPLRAGQSLTFHPRGLIAEEARPNGILAAGSSTDIVTLAASGGISGIRGPRGALVGVFTGPALERNAAPPPFEFVPGTDPARVEPVLQQVFYIGLGLRNDFSPRPIVVPAGASRLFLGVLDPGSATRTGKFLVHVGHLVAEAPSIRSVVNGAGFGSGAVSANSIVSVFGAGYGEGGSATEVPLPESLGGTEVYVDEYRAPLFFVSPGQVNAQMPVEVAGRISAAVTVRRANLVSPPFSIVLSGFRPGLFTYGEMNSPVIVSGTSGRLVTGSEPSFAGDTLVLYASGLGPALPAPGSGRPAPFDTLSRGIYPLQVVFEQDGRTFGVAPVFSGLAPGFVGVYQINVVVPGGISAGRASLRLVSDGLPPSPTYAIDFR
jgi:uncharacterized protein (TIGR03437 family)